MNESFQNAIMVKVMFHPERVRRCQAALLYAGLAGYEFSADEILTSDITEGDTKVQGIAVRLLSVAGMLHCVGRAKAKSKSRHGAGTNVWRLPDHKRSTANTWLERNGFAPVALPQTSQLEMAV